MPEMTGSDVGQRIREIRLGMPIIMLSAFLDLTKEQLKHVDAFTTKGEAPEVLLRIIENVQLRHASNGW